jgi:hypothetical protein
MTTMAVTYRDMGRITESMELMQKSLRESERVLGDNHPITMNLKAWLDSWVGNLFRMTCTKRKDQKAESK